MLHSHIIRCYEYHLNEVLEDEGLAIVPIVLLLPPTGAELRFASTDDVDDVPFLLAILLILLSIFLLFLAGGAIFLLHTLLFPYPLETTLLVYTPVAKDDIGFLLSVAAEDADATLPSRNSTTAFRTSLRIEVSLSADKSKLADLLDVFDLLDLCDLLLCILPCESRTPALFFFTFPTLPLNAIPLVGIDTKSSLAFNNFTFSSFLLFATIGIRDRATVTVEVFGVDEEDRAGDDRVAFAGALPPRTIPFTVDDKPPTRRVIPTTVVP